VNNVYLVAPHAGAWIETFADYPFHALVASHPMRVRGLKPASFPPVICALKSHPMRVRGLKQSACNKEQNAYGSHPMRVRGLKPFVADHV